MIQKIYVSPAQWVGNLLTSLLPAKSVPVVNFKTQLQPMANHAPYALPINLLLIKEMMLVTTMTAQIACPALLVHTVLPDPCSATDVLLEKEH